MFSFKSAMITSEPRHQEDDEHAKRERQHVVGVVRSGGDVQEEDQVNAHLGDGEHGKAEGNAGCPEQRRVGDPERRGRQDHCQNQPIV